MPARVEQNQLVFGQILPDFWAEMSPEYQVAVLIVQFGIDSKKYALEVERMRQAGIPLPDQALVDECFKLMKPPTPGSLSSER